MPVLSIGPRCARRDCHLPEWKDGLCGRCWRLGHMFGKDPRLFAYEPLHGWGDEKDAIPLPWERLEGDLLGEEPDAA